MAIYGISAVKMNAGNNEVEEAKVHRAFRSSSGGAAFDAGASMPYGDIADMCIGGDEIWTIVPEQYPGEYVRIDKVRRRPGAGQLERIESFDKSGAPSVALFDLPKY